MDGSLGVEASCPCVIPGQYLESGFVCRTVYLLHIVYVVHDGMIGLFRSKQIGHAEYFIDVRKILQIRRSYQHKVYGAGLRQFDYFRLSA